ncbi:MAG: DUF3800 domain-containing protein [Candidatus Omnitrophica bacterium]|nr:DUF3800 domain-containing protein [Candidatus Omnitrophota bacterium]
MYLFLDESGDWNFNKNGSEHLVFTCLITKEPFLLSGELERLKYNLIQQGYDISYFHASEDRQFVRDQVYSLLKDQRLFYEVDVVYFEKNKANPSLYLSQSEPKLYLQVYEVLLKYVFNRYDINDITILTDEIPHKKWREGIKKGLKISIKRHLNNAKFVILHHASKTNFCLQAADYFSWAYYRKLGNWGDKEDRPYNEIKSKMINDGFNMFGFCDGTTYY